MAEEIFFSKFIDALRESSDSLTPLRERAPFTKELYLERWNSCDASRDPELAVVACDGSIGESSFSGGLTVWVARAIAHIYFKDHHIVSVQDVDVKIGHTLLGRSLFMKALELKVLREATEKAIREYGGAFAMLDGNLYLTFLHHPPRLQNMAWIYEKYLRELTSLLKLTRRGVTVLGLSKDSDISYLRARIMLDAILNIDPYLGSELSKGRIVSRIAERLRQRIESHPILRDYLDELEQETSDEELYGEIVAEPGFTTPLLLAPQTLYTTEEINKGTKDWRGSAFRKRLDGHGKLSSLIHAFDEYFGQSPIAISYWKPRDGVRAYRIDVPSDLLGYRGCCDDISEDMFWQEGVESMMNLVATLNWLSHSPFVVNPLMEVDILARLDRKLYKVAYEPVIVEELRKRGFKAIPRKRSLRDLILRGY